MTDWREVRLGELCDVTIGRQRSPKHASGPNMTPYLRAANVKDGTVLTSDILQMNFTPEEQKTYLLASGDVLVTEGCGSAAELGASAQWRDQVTGPMAMQNTLLRLRSLPGKSDPDFLHALARHCHRSGLWLAASSGTSILHIGLRRAQQMIVRAPSVEVQRKIGHVFRALDDLIENNRRRIELLEDMAKAIYHEWFVRFRYPGREDHALVESPLGPIPERWEIKQVIAIAGTARNAVTGGPFGSKLGRKDYVGSGVPVLRGANLRVGGGFDESDLVFVCEEKAAELHSSLATRGDVIVTQRGTLGQVGLIPRLSRFDRYLLSQSQMKITVDSATATAEFVYAQLRTAETTSRFVSQAMSSGVPHVNLSLLRGLEIIVPPFPLQAAFTEAVAPLFSQEWHLADQRRSLAAIRDLLLPRLVTGQVDVSPLDLDILPDSVA